MRSALRALLAAVATTLALAAPSASADWPASSKVPLARVLERTTVRFAACPFVATGGSCSVAWTGSVDIYIDLQRVRHQRIPVGWAFYHEAGHAFDFLFLTDALRARLQRIMDLVGEEWFSRPDDGVYLRALAPSEKFAEAFRLCAVFGVRVTDRQLDRAPRVGLWDPFAVEQRRVCREIIRLARRAP